MFIYRLKQVPYNLTGWLEKNKDPLNDTVVDQFKKGSNQLMIEIFADHPGQSGGKDEGGKGKPACRPMSEYFYRRNHSHYITELNYLYFIHCVYNVNIQI